MNVGLETTTVGKIGTDERVTAKALPKDRNVIDFPKPGSPSARGGNLSIPFSTRNSSFCDPGLCNSLDLGRSFG